MAAVVVAVLRVVGGLVAIILIKKLPRYDNDGGGDSNINWGLVAIILIKNLLR